MDSKKGLRTAVFIDGAFFSRVLRHFYPNAPIAYDKLAERIARPGNLLRTYYYDALPYLSEAPTEAQREAAAGKKRFFHALENLPNVQVREGRCVRSWNAQHAQHDTYTYKQKFVDVSLATDLVRLAAKSKIDAAVIVTGDSDFIPAAFAVKDEGVQVSLLVPAGQRNVSHALAVAADRIVVLDDATMEACRLPPAA